MATLATMGITIRVTPWDDVMARYQDSFEFVDDRTPFEFQVEGRLEDGQVFYGIYGPVASDPERYRGLICNAILRADGADWRISSRCDANFKVGPSIATRCHAFDFRHPDGTQVSGHPVFSRFGKIEVAPTDGTK